MALTDKDILITPNIGSTNEPKIEFKGASASVGPSTITATIYPTNNGTLSFDGTAGQLFSITNNLTSGSIFSVNDVSGIPSINVDANGTINFGSYGGNIGIGVTNPTQKLHVQGNARITGALYDSNNLAGTSGQVLKSTGVGITWTSQGSGGGLDADTLDGLNSGYNGVNVILRTDANAELLLDDWIRIGSGTGLYNSNGAHFYEDTSYGWFARSRVSSSSIRLQSYQGTVRGWLYANDANEQGFLDTSGNWRLQVPNSGNILRNGIFTIWDSGNDGSGSGLDADLLDGKNTGTSGNTIPLLDGNNTWSGSNLFTATLNVSTTNSFTIRASATGESYNPAGAVSNKNQYFNAGTIVSLVSDTNSVDSGCLIDFNAYNSSSGATGVFIGAAAGPTGNGPANFVVGRRTGTQTWSESLRVNTNGNLGINTANPTSRLHVVGDALITGVTTSVVTYMNELVIDAGTRSSTNDATVYITATNNNDWGLLVNKFNSSATEYGADIRVGDGATYALRIVGSGSEKFRVEGSGNIHTVNGVYASNWFRSYGETGFYSQSYGQHFYPDSGGFYWESDGPIRHRDGYEGSVIGYSFYHDASGKGHLAASGEWWLNQGVGENGTQLVIGGNTSLNAYNSVTGRRLMFGSGSADARDNYYIGTNLENYGGNYNKLDLRWHTGIRMGAQPSYGGIRFYDTEALGTQVFAIGKDGSYAQANQSMRAPIFYDLDDTGYKLDATSTANDALRIRGGTLHGPNVTWGKYLHVGGDGRQGYIDNADVASVSTTNGNLHIDAASGYYTYINHYDGSGVFFGNGASAIVAEIASNGTFRSPVYYDYNDTSYYLDPASATSMAVAGIVNTNAGRLVLRDNSLENHATDNDTSEIAVNYYGYASGTTRFRDFAIYNGKNVSILRAVGSTGNVLINNTTATGTASQPFQVTGGAYVSGNLGIGTTNPGDKLHVEGGNIRIQNTNPFLTFSDTTIASSSYRIGVSEIVEGDFFIAKYSGSAYQIDTFYIDSSRNVLIRATSATGTASQPLQVTGGAYVSGNTGIGLTNPLSRLSVNAALDEASIGGYAANNTFIFGLGRETNSLSLDAYSEILFRTGSTSGSRTGTIKGRFDSSGNLLINASSATGTASQRLQVTGGAYVSGNLGVGITNPSAKLQVVGDVVLTTPTTSVVNITSSSYMWNQQINGGNNWYIGPTNSDFGIGINKYVFSSSGSSPSSELVLERGNTKLLEVLQSDLFYKTNRVWHAGNDGSGSGLDADTLDGLNSTQFLRSDISATNSGDLSANRIIGGTGTGIGGGGLVVNGTTNNNDSQLIIKKPSQSSFSVLAWDGTVFLTANIYYVDGGWVHDAPTGNNNNQLFLLKPGTGAVWYASNNGTSSWNVAADLTLWNDSGVWQRPLSNTLTLNTSGTGLSGSTTYNNSGAATFTVTSNATSANTASTIVARDASGNFSAGNITATNFSDGTGTYNVNLGSGGSEGRGLVAGYSGGSYGGIGYNVRHTTTGGVWVAPGGDTSSYLLFNSAGFTFYGAGAGAAGRTLSFSTLANLNSSGTLTLNNVQLNASGYIGMNNGTTYGLSVLAHKNSAVFDTVESTGTDPLELNYYQGGPVKIGSGTNGSKSLYAVGIYDNGNAVWHAGNDGTGSGLDADLLDGKNTGTSGNTIPLLDGNNTWSGTQTFSAQIQSTKANDAATGGGQIYLNGATGNRIDFNQNGVAAPAFNTRSAGTKLVLYPSLSASAVDYGFGIENSTLWSSVGSTGDQFKWYAGTTNIATLTGGGNLGIGESNPASKLTVRSDSAGGRGGEISIVNYATSTVGNEAALNFGLENSTYNADNGNAQIKARVNNVNAATDMIFSTWNGSAFGERARIQSTGEVLIGTATLTGTASQPLQVTGGAYVSGNLGVGAVSPSYKLDVNGSIRASVTGGGTGLLLHVNTGWSATANLAQFWTGQGSGFAFYANSNGDGSNVLLHVAQDGNVTATTSLRAPIFYDSNNVARYLDPDSTSELETVKTRGLIVNPSGNTSTPTAGYLSFWSTNGTTSRAQFVRTDQLYGTHGAVTDQYAQYWLMDTANRGWIFRHATSDTAGTNVFSIRNNDGRTTIGAGGFTAGSVHAQVNIHAGSGSATTYRDIDLWGNWAGGEGHAITATYGTGSSNIVGQMVFQHDNPGSRIKWGRLYHSGDQSTYPMNLISLDTSGNASLRMSAGSDIRAPIFYDIDNANYYLDPASTSVLSTLINVSWARIGGAAQRSNYGLTVGFTDNTTFASNTDVGDSVRTISVINESTTVNAMSVLGFRINPGGNTLNAMMDMKFVNTGATNTSTLHFSFNHGGSFSERVTFKSDGNVGINSTSPTEKLDVIGTVKATDFNTTSDETLKTNISTIENSLEKVSQIRGVNFEWKDGGRKSAGVIAQEIEKVLPELVRDNGTKTVNYNGLIGVLIEAVKELSAEVETLKTMINK